MQTEIVHKTLSLDVYIHKPVQESHVVECKTITEDTMLIDEDTQEKCLYLTNIEKYIDIQKIQILQKAIKQLPYKTTRRTGGLLTTSLTFGYYPRNAVRKNVCSIANMSKHNTVQHNIFTAFSVEADFLLQKFFPKEAETQKKLLEEVLPEWKFKGGLFTSGIVNKDNQLNYHKDNGNTKSCLSVMFVFKRNITGGKLHMPQYNISIELDNMSALIFHGGTILHGVTPFQKLSNNAYRYTIVYYPLHHMTHCLPYQEEILQANDHRTKISKLKKDDKQTP